MVIVQYHLPGDVVLQVRRSFPSSSFQQAQQPLWYYRASIPQIKISPYNSSMRIVKNERAKGICSPISSPYNQTQFQFISRMGAAATTANCCSSNKKNIPLIHCTSIKNIVLCSSSDEKGKNYENQYGDNADDFLQHFSKAHDIKSDQVTNMNICSLPANSMEETSPEIIHLSDTEQEQNKESKYFDTDWGARIKIAKNTPNLIRLRVNFSNNDINRDHADNSSSLTDESLLCNDNTMNDQNGINSKFGNSSDHEYINNWASESNQYSSTYEVNLFPFSNNPKVKLESLGSINNEKDVLSDKCFRQIDSNLERMNQENSEDFPDNDLPHESLHSLNKSNLNVRKDKSKISPKISGKMPKTRIENKHRNPLATILKEKFPFVTKDNIFDVELTKTSRGLGLSICGGWDTDPTNLASCFIRIKRLYPLQPAFTCGKINVGDIILSVNGRNLTGLSYAEAIEVLRMASENVKLTICRPEEGFLPPIPENPRVIISSLYDGDSNQPEFFRPFVDIQYMEFDVTLTKIAGSLGFTITNDDENPGHYIKDLVKEPALSCGSLQSGDKIILVNGIDISDMDHSEAITFFRSLPDEVTLCLWRQVVPISSPVSPLSPTVPFFTDDEKKTRPKPLLRKEALDMLSDKARLKKEKKINDSPKSLKRVHDLRDLSSSDDNLNENITQNNKFPMVISTHSTNCSNECISPTSSGITSTIYSSSQNTDICETDSSGFGDILDNKVNENQSVHIINSECSPIEGDVHEYNFSDYTNRLQRPSFLDLSSDNISPRKQMFRKTFIPNQEEIMSDNFDSNFENSDGSDMISTDNGVNTVTSSEPSPLHCTNRESALMKWRGTTLNGEEEESSPEELRPSLFTVELDRRWNNRLGFSLIASESMEASSGVFVKHVYPGSLAAIDGRLQEGDRLIKVNDNLVAELSVEEVIDLLRKSQGKVILTIERIPDNFHGRLGSAPRNTLIRSQSQNEGLLSNEITAMNVKNNNISRCFHWETNSTSPVDNELYSGFVNLKV